MLRSLIKSCKQVADGFSRVPLAPEPVVLYSFQSPAVLDNWHVFTDAFFGGKSSAQLTYNEQEQAAEFSGRLTLDQEPDADIKRAGYCVASSKVRFIGDYTDLSGIASLVFTVRGDGRTYIANVRTDSLAGTGGDVWQAPLRARAGEWSRVVIPIDDLTLTYQGQLVERKLEFQADKVISVGVAASAAMAEASSSGRSEDSTTTRQEASSLQAPEGDASSQHSSSTDSGSSGSGSGAGSVDEQACIPAHEFRLLIREISAEGEM